MSDTSEEKTKADATPPVETEEEVKDISILGSIGEFFAWIARSLQPVDAAKKEAATPAEKAAADKIAAAKAAAATPAEKAAADKIAADKAAADKAAADKAAAEKAVGGTTTSTSAVNASSTTAKVVPDTSETTLTTDVYGMFVGGFFIFLSLVVLFTTGSIFSVLVVWAVVALILTVMVYYGFISLDQFAEVPEEEVEKEVEVPVSPPAGGPMVGSEVFHISDQQFTYDEAPAVCAAYGAELATLEQIMDSFAKGAEWCSYGWSAGAMALYPTQKETWDLLQGEVDHGKKTRCGRPGVNGGYFDPSMKFGVNCFGFKPAGRFTPPAPVPGMDSARFNAMVNRFKALMKTFNLDPYSRMDWSKYGGNTVDTVKTIETFVSGFFTNPYKQEFFTPVGVREHLEGNDEDYVEPIGSTGLGNRARTLEGPFGLMGDMGPE